MLHSKILTLLNEQINLEHFSSNLYLSSGAWCIANGYENSGQFLLTHAKEELMHMDKLFTYILETGSRALVGAIEKPKDSWETLRAVFEDTLEHERKVTERINNLVANCFQQNDFSTFNFLQWYVAEQHEEEALFMGILDKFKLIGEDSKALFFIDREIGGITQASAPPA
jgi:ferritin